MLNIKLPDAYRFDKIFVVSWLVDAALDRTVHQWLAPCRPSTACEGVEIFESDFTEGRFSREKHYISVVTAHISELAKIHAHIRRASRVLIYASSSFEIEKITNSNEFIEFSRTIESYSRRMPCWGAPPSIYFMVNTQSCGFQCASRKINSSYKVLHVRDTKKCYESCSKECLYVGDLYRDFLCSDEAKSRLPVLEGGSDGNNPAIAVFDGISDLCPKDHIEVGLEEIYDGTYNKEPVRSTEDRDKIYFALDALDKMCKARFFESDKRVLVEYNYYERVVSSIVSAIRGEVTIASRAESEVKKLFDRGYVRIPIDKFFADLRGANVSETSLKTLVRAVLSEMDSVDIIRWKDRNSSTCIVHKRTGKAYASQMQNSAPCAEDEFSAWTDETCRRVARRYASEGAQCSVYTTKTTIKNPALWCNYESFDTDFIVHFYPEERGILRIDAKFDIGGRADSQTLRAAILHRDSKKKSYLPDRRGDIRKARQIWNGVFTFVSDINRSVTVEGVYIRKIKFDFEEIRDSAIAVDLSQAAPWQRVVAVTRRFSRDAVVLAAKTMALLA